MNRSYQPMLMAVLMLLVASLPLSAIGGDKEPIPVSTIKLELQDHYTLSRHFVGRVEANRVSETGFELPGIIKQIHKDEGDVVKAGDILAELDTQKLRAHRAEIEADLEQARSARKLAQTSLERVQRVAGKKLIDQQSLDEARAARDSAEARLARTQAALQAIDVDIRKAVLKAPFDGVVIARRHDEGDVVAAGAGILQIQEDGSFLARVGIANHLADRYHAGQTVKVDIAGEQTPAKIKAILPVRNRGIRTVDVLLALPAMNVRPGDLVDWRVGVDVAEQGFWLPVTALTEGLRGMWNVYAVDDNQQAQLRMVEVIHQSGEQAYVRGLVHEGDSIINTGIHRIVPQQSVRIASVDEAKQDLR